MGLWIGVEAWLVRASAFYCHPIAIAFTIQGYVIQLVLAIGYLVASKTRGKELKQIRDSEAAGNSLAFLYTNVEDFERSVQEKLPRVSVIMPIKGIGEHHMSNWRSQVLSMYGGPVEFIFVAESKQDTAYMAVSKLLLELKGQVQARIICAGLSTMCSQKVHNQLAGVDAMHKDSEYVLFLDDDVRLHPGAIGNVVTKMEQNPKIFVLTGYPFDLPKTTLGAYCIYEYHLPCSIGFATTGDQTFFLWGGFMMMHAEDFRCNRYGMVTGLKNGGYSDDMTLAAVAAANGRMISSPPQAIFFHPLSSNLSFSQYWNYLQKQTIVLETYITSVNYMMNRALFYTHCWLSWGVIFPTFAALLHITAILYSSFVSPSLQIDTRTGLVMSICAVLSKLTELSAIRHLSRAEIDLCNALSPENRPVSIHSYNWFLIFTATIVDNFLYPVSAFISTFTQHINWSGVDYYFQNGRICKIERSNKTKSQASSLFFQKSFHNLLGESFFSQPFQEKRVD
ncbi:unnamed protein product [Calypogeia fissa]